MNEWRGFQEERNYRQTTATAAMTDLTIDLIGTWHWLAIARTSRKLILVDYRFKLSNSFSCSFSPASWRTKKIIITVTNSVYCSSTAFHRRRFQSSCLSAILRLLINHWSIPCSYLQVGYVLDCEVFKLIQYSNYLLHEAFDIALGNSMNRDYDRRVLLGISQTFF